MHCISICFMVISRINSDYFEKANFYCLYAIFVLIVIRSFSMVCLLFNIISLSWIIPMYNPTFLERIIIAKQQNKHIRILWLCSKQRVFFFSDLRSRRQALIVHTRGVLFVFNTVKWQDGTEELKWSTRSYLVGNWLNLILNNKKEQCDKSAKEHNA